MPSYNDMARTVLDFYTNPDQLVQYGGWEEVFDPNTTYSLEQAYEAIRNNPNIQIIERTDGTVVGWWSKSTGSGNLVSDIGSLPNSNISGGSNTSSALTNVHTQPEVIADGVGGGVKIKNASKINNIRWEGAAGVGMAVAAVSTGLSLGVTIDKALYKYNPLMFSDETLEKLNPENWKQISSAVDEQWTEMGYPTVGKIGRMVCDAILGVDSTDNSTQMYIDEDVYAYMAWYLQSKGAFTTEGSITPGTEVPIKNYPKLDDYSITFGNDTIRDNIYKRYGKNIILSISNRYVSKESDQVYIYYAGTWDLPTKANITKESGNSYRFSGLDANVYYETTNFYRDGRVIPVSQSTERSFRGHPASLVPYDSSYSCTLVNVDMRPNGISSQTDATLPDFSTATDLESFKNLLKQQYPDNWTNSVTRQVLQPDGTLKTFTYVPVPTPNATDWMDTQPTGDGSQQSQKDTVVNPDMDTSIKDTISSSGSTGSTTPNPPDTGGGDSPTVVPPVGKASSLWSIYNPTLEQVNQFGSWLWSSNFVEQLKKLFNDPMQAIIGLHKVYSPVQTTGQGTIKCGYLDSGVPSKLVSEQYVTVDCGSVDMQEYFGNVFDYPPYTEISIYLPFIGIRQLDPSDVMRSTISVKYHVDVLTGACLAEVNVQRDASGGTLYTFSGDAAVRYPVSSGSYMSIVSSLVGMAAGVGMIAAAPTIPGIIGATVGVAHTYMNAHTNVQHSGSFTGSAGAMGSKVPYIIISRPQTAMADKFETLSGYPSNTYTPLSACKGFTQVKYCHVENLSATETEKNEIERLLKEGVIL
jgi:hypothetical protein